MTERDETPIPADTKREAERLILANLAGRIVETAKRVAAEYGLPIEATAESLIAACCALLEQAHGRDATLEWLHGQLKAGRPIRTAQEQAELREGRRGR